MSIVCLYPLKANIVLPTNAELAILRVLWKKGPSTVRSFNVFIELEAAGAFGNRLSEPVSVLLTYGFLFVWAVLAIIWVFPSPSLSEGMSDWIRVLFMTFVPYVWLVDFLGCAFKSVYGRELLPWSLGLQVRSHSAPDHSGKLSVLTFPYRGRKRPLRHGIYDHELATKTIASWIDGRFQLSPVLS
jgi:hypothetical protein